MHPINTMYKSLNNFHTSDRFLSETEMLRGLGLTFCNARLPVRCTQTGGLANKI